MSRLECLIEYIDRGLSCNISNKLAIRVRSVNVYYLLIKTVGSIHNRYRLSHL